MEIPRITCSLFGAIKAAATMKNTVILVHGPRGCVYHINYILGLRGDRHSPVYCTCMNEHDIVFGAEDRLREAIEELDEARRPEVMIVLACCASGIIGEDVQNACRTARTRSSVVSIEAGGFTGDFTAGYAKTLKEIAAALAGPRHAPIPGSVNIIGMLRAGPDIRVLRHLLSRLGLTVGVVFPAGASAEQVERIGDASLNIVICETSGIETAQYLKERYDTPYIRVTFPIGAALSREFLAQAASALGISPVPPVPDDDERAGDITNPPSIAIFSGPTRALALSRFLSSHGMAPALIVLDFETSLLDEIRRTAGLGCTVLVSPGWDALDDLMRSNHPGLLIGGLMERPLAARLGIPLIDVMHGSQRTAGPEGGEDVLRLIRECAWPVHNRPADQCGSGPHQPGHVIK